MSQEESSNSQGSPPKGSGGGIAWGWIVLGLFVAVTITMVFMMQSQDTFQYYMTVSEYNEASSKYENKNLKLAGKVKMGSLKNEGDRYDFVMEDLGQEIAVTYIGLAPDTFKEGAEVVVEGRGPQIPPFIAKSLMAKCASKYEVGGLPPLEQMRSKSLR